MQTKDFDDILIEYKRYRCDFFRQRPKAPIQCSFVATTADISEWGTVPKKASDDLRNFQRPELESHVGEIAAFFEQYEDNSSPSAIVVGFKQIPRTLDQDENLLDLKSIKAGQSVSGFIEIPCVKVPVANNIEEKKKVLIGLIKVVKDLNTSGGK